MPEDPCLAASDTLLVRTVCGLTLVLILCTWRLWFGQEVFPQIPLVALGTNWPRWIDNLSFATLAAALGATIVGASQMRMRRLGLSAALLSLSLLWITDQHRLQPWAYHFALTAWILLFRPAPDNRRWLRAVIVSVYLYSALSKFDARFLHTHGAMFVETGVELIGLNADRMGRASLSRLAIGLPLGELAASVLLAVPALRRYGRWAAAVLHLTMIALLGPWGLDHRWGVLMWNVAFLAQVLIVFAPSGVTGAERFGATAVHPGVTASRLSLIPVIAALVLPVLEPLERWDSWLSWGLYSTRAAKLDLYLPRDSAERLPASVRAFCESPSADSIWLRVAMDRWSLETLQAPIYPQQRFQLGVALAVVRLLPPDERHLSAVFSSAPDRRSGRVQTRRVDVAAELEAYAAAFFWNVQPREPVMATGAP
jgi:hypothetical protein